MCKKSFYVTCLASKVNAFEAGSNLMPTRFRQEMSINGNKITFRHNAKEPLECKIGDIVYYGQDYGEGAYLSLLDPRDYFVIDGVVYEREAIYKASLVDHRLPDFLSDIDIWLSGSYWILSTSRLRIKVNFGDYWIRDTDPYERYKVPIVSVIERDGCNFDRYWVCDENGKPIERLSDYDARLNSAPSF